MKKIDYVKPMIRVYVMEDTCSLPETSGGMVTPIQKRILAICMTR